MSREKDYEVFKAHVTDISALLLAVMRDENLTEDTRIAAGRVILHLGWHNPPDSEISGREG
jgi:hypothetical protein